MERMLEFHTYPYMAIYHYSESSQQAFGNSGGIAEIDNSGESADRTVLILLSKNGSIMLWDTCPLLWNF